ncbi:hypothetical protein DERP_001779 [Dermatophagoides pteronyssinus]|uniref:Uncharacterized protein n=1 Tax=Dermatophagoides pteronyssinus TaxID=6956 RepID=A0ABQ8JBG2_DERPT|nr:hypothetical protein DERP_001779 [Dermatophagoides pteronyssinus]
MYKMKIRKLNLHKFPLHLILSYQTESQCKLNVLFCIQSMMKIMIEITVYLVWMWILFFRQY